MGLLAFKMDRFSQNGEDGILERIFHLVGTETKTCCEFGAWDGMHLSNTRKLLLDGWSGLLIEADPNRFEKLKENYLENPGVKCACKFVNEADDLEQALAETGFLSALDLLSIDIDGLDYYILEGLQIRPRVICVEVNAGHSPESNAILPRDLVAKNVGQPLPAFCRVAEKLGYKLIGYNGNAFFLRSDITHPLLTELDPVAAYAEYVGSLNKTERRWMYLVNRGLVLPDVPSFFRFRNDCLTAKKLDLGPIDISVAVAQGMLFRLRVLLHRLVAQLGKGAK